MTTTIMTTPGFATSEGLRSLLTRLDDGGADAWREDGEAADLMRFTMSKYGALAHKHGFEPADAAVALTPTVAPAIRVRPTIVSIRRVFISDSLSLSCPRCEDMATLSS